MMNKSKKYSCSAKAPALTFVLLDGLPVLLTCFHCRIQYHHCIGLWTLIWPEIQCIIKLVKCCLMTSYCHPDCCVLPVPHWRVNQLTNIKSSVANRETGSNGKDCNIYTWKGGVQMPMPKTKTINPLPRLAENSWNSKQKGCCVNLTLNNLMYLIVDWSWYTTGYIRIPRTDFNAVKTKIVNFSTC